MKEIVIKYCGDCPFGEIKGQGEKASLFCGLEERKIGNLREKMDAAKFRFPEFCKLAEFGEEIKYLVAKRNVEINTIFKEVKKELK